MQLLTEDELFDVDEIKELIFLQYSIIFQNLIGQILLLLFLGNMLVGNVPNICRSMDGLKLVWSWGHIKGFEVIFLPLLLRFGLSFSSCEVIYSLLEIGAHILFLGPHGWSEWDGVAIYLLITWYAILSGGVIYSWFT